MAGQESMLISVLQGERELAKDNWKLGEFAIPFDRAPKGQARVGVQFEIDANGILHVLARDTKTGAQRVVEMASAVDVSDEAVELMISESLEHAFEDMSDRIFTEAKLKSMNCCPPFDGLWTASAPRCPKRSGARSRRRWPKWNPPSLPAKRNGSAARTPPWTKAPSVWRHS